MVLKIKAAHSGVRRYCVNAFLAPRAKQLQGRVHVHFRVVEFGNRRGRSQVTLIDENRVVISLGNGAELGNVFIKLDVHQAVLGQRVHGDGLGATRLQPEQRFGHGHLINQRLRLSQRRLRDAMPGLDDAGCSRFFSGGHTSGACEKPADVNRVGGVVRTLVNHLEHIVTPDDAGRHLHAASAPAIGKRHFTRAKRHLVAGYGHGLEYGAAYHFFGPLIEESEVVIRVHQAAFCRVGSVVRAASRLSPCASWPACFSCACAARNLRTSSSSDWKST